MRVPLLRTLKRKKNLWCYPKHINKKLYEVRQKERIKVLFVLSELATWKTENLYLEMLSHPRFKPILGVTLSIEDSTTCSAYKCMQLIEYIKAKGYSYEDVYCSSITEHIKPDIIFYTKPYNGIINPSVFYENNLDSLFCFLLYAYNTVDNKILLNVPFYDFCTQFYIENTLVQDIFLKRADKKRSCFRITGVPQSDALRLPATCNPWKNHTYCKKRIIYAPHWTIPIKGENKVLNFASFLEFGEYILSLAECYSKETQWLFKPHPLLKGQLEKVWGKERTDEYYDKWISMENSQYEDGMYLDYFKNSDAMIHDSGSFTVEYLYMGKPVMYLVNGKPHESQLNEFGKAAYAQHYKANTEADIEQFVLNVINGIDPMKEQREKFFNDYLLPPKGKTASENIIDAILGQNGYE